MEPLFYGRSMAAVLSDKKNAMLEHIRKFSDESILETDAQTEGEEIASKFVIIPAVLLADERYVKEIKTRTPQEVEIGIPYQGEAVFFTYRPANVRQTLEGPLMADVINSVMSLVLPHSYDAAATKVVIERAVNLIKANLAESTDQAEKFNAALASVAISAIQNRQAEIRKEKDFLAGLDLPIKQDQ